MKEFGKIYSTTDYSIFKYRIDNREIKSDKVTLIAKSIKQIGLKSPILVDSDYQVHDGQHRLAACKLLNRPVHFIIDQDPMSTMSIAELQSTTTSWKTHDYAKSFAASGNKNYILYEQIKNLYPEFGHTTLIALLCDHTGRNKSDEANFRNGTLSITNTKKTIETIEMLRKIAPFYKNYCRRAFILAFLKMKNHPEFNYKRFMRKLPMRCKSIHDFSKSEDFVNVLQDIYNWKETKKVLFV